MPRNASGIYTLPVASFIAGTVIRSADMNTNLSDIATALTQSLATTGVTAMSAPLPAIGGTVTNPGYTFTGDLNTGIYQVSADSIGVAVGGVNALIIASDTSTTWAGSATFNVNITVTGTSNLNGPVIFSSASPITFNNTTFTFASSTVTGAFWTGIAANYVITFTIDGGGSVPATGSKGFFEVPCNSTVLRWTIMADQTGSAIVDVNKSTYAGFPPTVSIAGSERPTLSSARNNQDTNLTTWTTALTAGDILGFDLDSVTTCTRVQVSLFCRRIQS